MSSPIRALPGQGSTDWYGHYSDLDAAARAAAAGLSYIDTPRTAAFTIGANTIEGADTSGGTFAATFPGGASPAPGTRVGLRWEAGTAAPTVAAGVPIGTGSATTASPFSMVGELLVWQVPAAGGRWRLVGKVLPQAGMDARYATPAKALVYALAFGE